MFQVQALKVLVNLSSNPDMMDDIVQAQVRKKKMLFLSDHPCFIQITHSLHVLIECTTSMLTFFFISSLLQAPASVVLLFDARTAPAVLLRLLTFAGNLKAWRPSAQVADELRRKQDCLFRVMLDESSQLHSRLVQLLAHPDGEIQAQVARILT